MLPVIGVPVELPAVLTAPVSRFVPAEYESVPTRLSAGTSVPKLPLNKVFGVAAAVSEVIKLTVRFAKETFARIYAVVTR